MNIKLKISIFVVITATMYTLVACSARVEFSSTPTNIVTVVARSSLSTKSTIQTAQTLAFTNTPTVMPTAIWIPLPTLTMKQGTKK